MATKKQKPMTQEQQRMADRLKFEIEYPQRLLNAIHNARAFNWEVAIGIGTEAQERIHGRRVDGDYVRFSDCSHYWEVSFLPADAEEWVMDVIESHLKEEFDRRVEKDRLSKIKESVLSRLTEEEKKALREG